MKQLCHYLAFSVLSIMLIAAFLHVSEPVNKDEYIEITISSGDTLWQLAEQYSESHKLSTKEFINWVMEVNNLTTQRIVAGDKIVIPVLKSDAEELLASN